MILLYLGFLRRLYSVSNYSPKYEDQHTLCVIFFEVWMT